MSLHDAAREAIHAAIIGTREYVLGFCSRHLPAETFDRLRRADVEASMVQAIADSESVRAALNAGQAQPFGYVTETKNGQEFFYRTAPYLDNAVRCTAVYAAPQAAQPATVKESLTPAQPVAEVRRDGATVRLEWASVEAAHNAKPGPLYTAPQASQPLTDDCIADLWNEHMVWGDKRRGNYQDFAEAIRAVERAHGIRSET